MFMGRCQGEIGSVFSHLVGFWDSEVGGKRDGERWRVMESINFNFNSISCTAVPRVIKISKRVLTSQRVLWGCSLTFPASFTFGHGKFSEISAANGTPSHQY